MQFFRGLRPNTEPCPLSIVPAESGHGRSKGGGGRELQLTVHHASLRHVRTKMAAEMRYGTSVEVNDQGPLLHRLTARACDRMEVIAVLGFTGSVWPRGGSMEQGALVVNSNRRSMKHLCGHLPAHMPRDGSMEQGALVVNSN